MKERRLAGASRHGECKDLTVVDNAFDLLDHLQMNLRPLEVEDVFEVGLAELFERLSRGVPPTSVDEVWNRRDVARVFARLARRQTSALTFAFVVHPIR